MVFKAFCTLCHYLERLKLLTDVITAHKNLEYFSTIKILSYCQARQLKFLSQFNLVIHFHPEHLESKPDTITQRENLYLKKGSAVYSSVNPQDLYPVFIHSQLMTFLQATALIFYPSVPPLLQTLVACMMTSCQHLHKIRYFRNTSTTQQNTSY